MGFPMGQSWKVFRWTMLPRVSQWTVSQIVPAGEDDPPMSQSQAVSLNTKRHRRGR